MTHRLVSLILCGGVAALGGACATKSFVREEVGATERKISEQMTTTENVQEAKLRETAGRVGETRQAVDVADQRINGLDVRVSEADARAGGAEAGARDVEARLSQRLATRNRYRLVETKSVYFDSGQTEVRSQDAGELESVAKALTADPNAVVELQGFADVRGSDRFNRELARERVEAVMRYLVQQHGIELRQARAISMGKATLATGEKPSPEILAKARRVDIRLLTPWSSWEDNLSEVDSTAPERSATVSPEPPGSETISAVPVRVTPVQPAPIRRRVPEFLKTITPGDLGGN
jgi:outer membrane protein OmpA-like peptidoglycan-associated protein